MTVTGRDSFQLSAFTSDGLVENDVPPAREFLAKLKAGEIWGDASIYPRTGDFPRALVSYHHSHGFVVQCYETEQSWSDFLITGEPLSAPRVEIVLGGLAMERWPPELFVSQDIATQALEFFLDSGKQSPDLRWIQIDRFPRETVWEGRGGREAWEQSQGRS